MEAKCSGCGIKTNKVFPECLVCVCCIPDCEKIGLFHSRCFQHWIITNQKLPQLCIFANCWQCQTQTRNIVLRNYEKLQYCFKSCQTK